MVQWSIDCPSLQFYVVFCFLHVQWWVDPTHINKNHSHPGGMAPSEWTRSVGLLFWTNTLLLWPTVTIRWNKFIGYRLASGFECNVWRCENLSSHTFYIQLEECRKRVRRYDTTRQWGFTKSRYIIIRHVLYKFLYIHTYIHKYKDTGIMDMDSATGSIYLGDPGVETHHCIMRNTHSIIPIFWSHCNGSRWPGAWWWPFCTVGSPQALDLYRWSYVYIYIYYHSHPHLQLYSISTIHMPVRPNAGRPVLTHSHFRFLSNWIQKDISLYTPCSCEKHLLMVLVDLK